MNLHAIDSTGRALGELRLSAWMSVVQLGAAQLGIADEMGNLLGTITCPLGCRQPDLDAMKSLFTPVREVRDASGFCS